MITRFAGMLTVATAVVATTGAVLAGGGAANAATAGCSSSPASPGHVSGGGIALTSEGAFLRGGHGHVLRYGTIAASGLCGAATEDLGGHFYNYPAAADYGKGSGAGVTLTVRGTDNRVYVKTGTPGHRSSWQSIGGTTNYPPSVAGDAQGSYRVFVTGSDRQLYTKTYTAGGHWSGWVAQEGFLTTGPGGTSFDAMNNVSEVFAAGRDHAVYELEKIVGEQHWTRIGGRTDSTPGYTSDAHSGYLLVRGTDNQIYYKSPVAEVIPGTDDVWRSLGGRTLSAPSSIFLAQGGATLFAEGTDHLAYVRELGSVFAHGRGPWSRA